MSRLLLRRIAQDVLQDRIRERHDYIDCSQLVENHSREVDPAGTDVPLISHVGLFKCGPLRVVTSSSASNFRLDLCHDLLSDRLIPLSLVDPMNDFDGLGVVAARHVVNWAVVSDHNEESKKDGSIKKERETQNKPPCLVIFHSLRICILRQNESAVQGDEASKVLRRHKNAKADAPGGRFHILVDHANDNDCLTASSEAEKDSGEQEDIEVLDHNQGDAKAAN